MTYICDIQETIIKDVLPQIDPKYQSMQAIAFYEGILVIRTELPDPAIIDTILPILHAKYPTIKVIKLG